MKRTLFSLTLILAIVLSACAQAGGSPASPGGAVELRFMTWGDPAELEVWKQIVADFQNEYPNVKVNVEVSDWDSYWTKLKTLLAANNPPDIFAIDAPLYKDYQSRGVLLNLKPYLDASPGLLDGLYPVTLKAYETPEGYFGLPRDFQTIVVFYNKDMFDAAGIPYPQQGWTYDDLREISKKLTKDTNGDGKVDQYGFYADLWDMELIWGEGIWAYGGDVISADYTRTLIGTPEARKAWQLFHDMIFVDGSWPDANTAAQYGGDPFLAGVAAMTTIGHWAIPGYAEASFKWDVAPMPTGPAGQATSVNSAGFVVAKLTKYPQESFNFIKFVLSEKGQTRLAELGFACPVLKSVAESPAFLEQEVKANHQVFLDSLAFARMKPSFKGYEEWSSVIGDGMAWVWAGEADLNSTLDEVVKQADEVLAKNK